MPVAKSFQKLKQLGEPYEIGSKSYVDVLTASSQKKTVRWYSTSEYRKMYPDEDPRSYDPYYKSQKEVLGFANGYITIFKGDTYPYKDWFKANGAYYTKLYGWSFFSTAELPADIPATLTPVRLNWDDIGNGEVLKSDAEVEKVVHSLIYEPSASQHQGDVGDRLTLHIKVDKVIQLDGYYGNSSMFIMSDIDKNVYVWTTSSKTMCMTEQNEYNIRGTVKAHSEYKNTKQTVLTRCAFVKEK